MLSLSCLCPTFSTWICLSQRCCKWTCDRSFKKAGKANATHESHSLATLNKAVISHSPVNRNTQRCFFRGACRATFRAQISADNRSGSGCWQEQWRVAFFLEPKKTKDLRQSQILKWQKGALWFCGWKGLSQNEQQTRLRQVIFSAVHYPATWPRVWTTAHWACKGMLNWVHTLDFISWPTSVHEMQFRSSNFCFLFSHTTRHSA